MGLWDTITGGVGDAWDWLNKKPNQTNPANAQLGNSGYMNDYLKQGLGGLGGRGAPQAGQTQIDDEFRRRQIDLANRLAGIEAGTQKGAGALAVDDAARRALASQQSLAAMSRGGNAALGARTAASNAQAIGGQMAGQSAQAQMGDQAAARQALMGLTSGARGQDIEAANMEQNRKVANVEAQLRQTGMNDEQISRYLQQMFNMSEAELKARIEQERINATGKSNADILGGYFNAGATLGGSIPGL